MEKRKFAVLTSGGDAPGMNAAIRAVFVLGFISATRFSGFRTDSKGCWRATSGR